MFSYTLLCPRAYAFFYDHLVDHFNQRLRTVNRQIKLRELFYKNRETDTFLSEFDFYNYHSIDQISEYLNKVSCAFSSFDLPYTVLPLIIPAL